MFPFCVCRFVNRQSDPPTFPHNFLNSFSLQNVTNPSLIDTELHPRRTKTHNINIRRLVKAESRRVRCSFLCISFLVHFLPASFRVFFIPFCSPLLFHFFWHRPLTVYSLILSFGQIKDAEVRLMVAADFSNPKQQWYPVCCHLCYV